MRPKVEERAKPKSKPAESKRRREEAQLSQSSWVRIDCKQMSNLNHTVRPAFSCLPSLYFIMSGCAITLKPIREYP